MQWNIIEPWKRIKVLTCDMHGLWRQCANWKKSDTKDHILRNPVSMTCLEYGNPQKLTAPQQLWGWGRRGWTVSASGHGMKASGVRRWYQMHNRGHVLKATGHTTENGEFYGMQIISQLWNNNTRNLQPREVTFLVQRHKADYSWPLDNAAVRGTESHTQL